MNGLLLLVIALAGFLAAYFIYGARLERRWIGTHEEPTPAHALRDDLDYCPADARVVLGHHFSSIAGAGPITGPILASVFGWVPVFLWVLLGSVFIGGVHDYAALHASLRHRGKSIGEIIQANIGRRGKLLFNLFAWLTLVLVVAAFTDICAETFAFDPGRPATLAGAEAGTASFLFIILAVGFGWFVYRRRSSLAVSSVIALVLLAACIWAGFHFPFLQLDKSGWLVALLVYISLASVLPVWILLQPRDYLSSFLLYAMLGGGIVGVVLLGPSVDLPAFAGFSIGGQTLFPFLFVTVACGAISGFHSLVSSGTTAKQLTREKPDARLVGYGAMLIEGLVAVLALVAVGSLAAGERGGSPATVFANGLSGFMAAFGLPRETGRIFVLLAFSAFALTSLDSATRIARYVFQEFFESFDGRLRRIGTNMYVATGVTVGASLALLLYGYKNIWPIFGSTNQLLAALALLAVTAWFARRGKKSLATAIPMALMFVITLAALGLLAHGYLLGEKPNALLGAVALLLLALALVLIVEAARAFRRPAH